MVCGAVGAAPPDVRAASGCEVVAGQDPEPEGDAMFSHEIVGSDGPRTDRDATLAWEAR